MKALDRKAWRDLSRLRGQVLSVALVVACGITCFVTMRSAHEALIHSRSSYYRHHRFAQIFAHLKRAPENLRTRIGRIPGVASVETRVLAEVTLEVPGLDIPATGRILSVPQQGLPQLNGIYLRQGRMLGREEMDEVLVSEAFAEANGLRPGDTLGAVLQGRWQRLRIVGVALSPEYVYEIQSGGLLPDNRRFGVLWMRRKALAKAFDLEGAFNQVSLTLAPGAQEPEILRQVDQLLKRYGGLGAYGRDQHLSHQFLQSEIDETRITSVVLPTIFLAVAAFLVHLVLSRLIHTQRLQIAVLKAFGYSNGALARHYLGIALVPVLAGTVVGGLAGEVLGRGLATMYTRFFHFPWLVIGAHPHLILQGFAIGATAALTGAGLAVRRVVRLPPAEAMRPEVPARFGPSALERIGLGRWISLPTRMILRNLERRPGKALLSALGIALAIALLVTGRFVVDAVEHLLWIQFHLSQREDVEVLLAKPAGPSAHLALGSLPGVLQAEPFRLVPVCLRHGQASRQTALLGLSLQGRLRPLIDGQGMRKPLPSEGLLLSATLAELLHLRVGQSVTVEVQEGSRASHLVVVSDVIQDLTGLRATMELGALHRLLREQETISGAYLKVDRPARPALYDTLKRLPAVGSIAVRQSMLESFQRTFAENMRISTSLLIGFACVIAMAVIYTGAHIALAERANELASLRILGFTRREIGILLLGEQALLLLAATPLGFALGYGLCAWVLMGGHAELFRLTLVLSPRTYAYSFLAVGTAAFLAGYLVYRRLGRLDLIAVLKSRE